MHTFTQHLCGLHKELLVRREGFGCRALSAHSDGWSVGSSRFACMSVGPVCAHRVGGSRQRPGERGQPELAGWVMNLLLRHSLRHNYTHPDQEGPSRPLTSSSNKSRAGKHRGFALLPENQSAATTTNRTIIFYVFF